MVLGFNHNVRYKGDVFHIQTEDSGVANPHIITLLYRGGTILSSKKTSYADILKIENLEQVVEELMKEQHKEMLRRLKQGEFDAKAFPNGAPAGQTRAEEPAPPSPPAAAVPAEPAAPPSPAALLEETRESPTSSRTLDEIILDYFAYDEK
jgi:hypothetical protein